MKRFLYSIVSIILVVSCVVNQETKRRMQYELQRVQELNRLFIPLDTVTIMDTVLDYYESHGSQADKMMASYMMGCVHRDKGNSPIALDYYRKAIKYADTTEMEDVRILSNIYAQIADLFNKQRAPQLEIEAEKEAVRLALKSHDTITAINYYAYLAGSYHMMNKMDSALLINQTAVNEYLKIGRKDLAAGVLPVAIDIYLRQKRLDEAQKAMMQFENYSGWIIKDSATSGHEFYYFYKGLYYENVTQNDSALYYYRKLLQYPQIENLQAAYEGLARTYKTLGQSDSVMKYAFLFAEANDSVSLKSSSQEIVKMQALYDYNEQQRLSTIKEREAERLKTFLYMIVIVVIIVGYFIYDYVKSQKRKNINEIVRVNSKYAELLSQYSQSLAELTSLKGGFEKYQIEKQKEIENLKQILSVYQSDKTSPEKWNIEQALLDSHIIRHLHKSASKAHMATSGEWNDLKETVSKYLPDFYHLIAHHKELSDKEVLVCILSKLRFIPSEMVVLLGATPQRITNIRSTINMKLFHDKGAQGLEANLRRL